MMIVEKRETVVKPPSLRRAEGNVILNRHKPIPQPWRGLAVSDKRWRDEHGV